MTELARSRISMKAYPVHLALVVGATARKLRASKYWARTARWSPLKLTH